MQQLPSRSELVGAAVSRISHNRVVNIPRMNPYLVRPPGKEFESHQGILSEALHYFIHRLRRVAALHDSHLFSVGRISAKRSFDNSAVLFQVAVNQQCGWLGEVSTEVFGVKDFNMTK